MTPAEQGWSYIGRLRVERGEQIAGTVVAAVGDDPEDPVFTADTVAEFLRDGLLIERVRDEWVRHHFLTTDPAP